MPEVKPPVIRSIPDIQVFAKAYLGVELTSHQLKLIDSISKGQEIRMHRRMGLSMANQVIRRYLAEGLNPRGRVRMAHFVPPRPVPMPKKMKGVTQEGKVLALIKRPEGAFNFELSRVALKYTSVISSLRKDGHEIVCDRQYLKNGRASNTFLYRLGGQ